MTSNASSSFIKRHIGPSTKDAAQMLDRCGYKNQESFLDAVIPGHLPRAPLLDEKIQAVSEEAIATQLRTLAAENTTAQALIGKGYVGTYMPAPIRRHLLQNAGWYTAYTPYQAEISQGRLELLLLFQQIVQDLTGLAFANASLLDEATAAAEAMGMIHRMLRDDKTQFLVDADTHPQTISVLHTRTASLGMEIIVTPLKDMSLENAFGALLSWPGSSGKFDPAIKDKIAECKKADVKVVLACDPITLLCVTDPGTLGANIAIGSMQSYGLPLGLGGPHAGFLACEEGYLRQMPGRIIGVSRDAYNRPALRMAMQTREQHIRRDRATSNICTAQALPAMLASAYAIYHGPEGLTDICNTIHRYTAILEASAEAAGWRRQQAPYLRTLTWQFDETTAATLVDRAFEAGFLVWHDGSELSITLDETIDDDRFAQLLAAFGLQKKERPAELPEELRRQTPFLTDPRFNLFQSETAIMRYLRALMDKDLALDRCMIPLGSCTMKLNPTVCMESLDLPGFANIHPLTPEQHIPGYRKLFDKLVQQLTALTGFDDASLQPNAGSQGEYSGLLAIRRYHLANGQAQRNLCLIPESAHGTNPASAVMAGMQVVAIPCNDRGEVDMAILTKKVKLHKDQLAALMITYPSTHGVFEETITDITTLVHQYGGQIYVDGANLNALVGMVRPGDLGADVMHFNLHKTFAIPHGGGGPGMGPIGVKKHLIEYLPGSPLDPPSGAVSGSAFGSGMLLAISWSFISLLGYDGLRQSSFHAILGANFIAKELEADYPVLYKRANGLVAHECILDCRGFREKTGVDAEAIAKRLVDFGFHAPTMSWPVAGCLMIEPTESESLEEITRFVKAMKLIRAEIRCIEQGEWPTDDNPLVGAPHTAEKIAVSEWTHPYSRQVAAFPAPSMWQKYWPPVARVDQVYGDRNFSCSCPPLSDYL